VRGRVGRCVGGSGGGAPRVFHPSPPVHVVSVGLRGGGRGGRGRRGRERGGRGGGVRPAHARPIPQGRLGGVERMRVRVRVRLRVCLLCGSGC
jgi:hypothetical protein